MPADSIVPKSFGEVAAGADNDSTRIQAFCQDRRNVSDRAWKAKFLSDHFEGLQPDKILARLLKDPSYEDPRNNLTVWARPNPAVTALAADCQAQLQELGLGKAFPQTMSRLYSYNDRFPRLSQNISPNVSADNLIRYLVDAPRRPPHDCPRCRGAPFSRQTRLDYA